MDADSGDLLWVEIQLPSISFCAIFSLHNTLSFINADQLAVIDRANFLVTPP